MNAEPDVPFDGGPHPRLTVEQVDALRDAAYAERFEARFQQRNDALVTLLYDTGLSARTLVELDADAVAEDGATLAVPAAAVTAESGTDGGSDAGGRRELPLDSTGRLGTRRLLASYRRSLPADSSALFPSRKGGRLTVRGVRYVVERLAEAAGVEPTTGDGASGSPADVTPDVIRSSGRAREPQGRTGVSDRRRTDSALRGPTPKREDSLAVDDADWGVDPVPGRCPVENPVLDALQDLFYVVDADARLRRWNDRVAEVTGYDDEELAGLHALKLVDPADRETVAAAIASVFDGNAETRETALRTSDGEHVPYEFNGTPIRNASGRVVAFAGVGRDIRERRRRERTLRRYRTIVNAVGDAVYQLDETGHIVTVNDVVPRVTGYDRDELLGEHVSKLLDDEDVVESAAVVADLLQADDRAVGELEFEVRTADGDVIPCHARVAVLEEDGEFQGTVGAVRDVSARKEWLRELQRQRDELETLDRINAVIRRIDGTLVQARSEAEIQRTVCTELADVDQYRFAWYGEYDAAGERIEPRTWAGVEDGYLDDRPGIESATGEDITAETAYRTGEIQVAQNIAADDSFSSWRDAALERGYRSAVAIPLTYRDATYGVLCVYAPRPHAFDDRECRVLSELGTNIAYAVSAVRRQEALATDSVVELEFRVTDPAFPLTALSAAAGAEVALNGIVSRGDEPSTAFVTATGASPSALREGARAAGGTADVVSADDDQVLLRFEAGSLLPFDVAAYGGVVRDAVARDGEASVTVEFPQSVDTYTVVDALRGDDLGVEFVARHDRERPEMTGAEFRSEFGDLLTDRQHEVLKTAFLAGYFERPRRSSGGDVADVLDVATPTFHEHVRAAEQKLLETYFE